MVIQLGGKQVGTESFKIDCPAGGGYAASGTTDMSINGATLALATSLETDANSVPTKFTMKGTSFGSSVDQIVVMKDGSATVTNAGVANTMPYITGAAMLANNVSYTFQFITNRYNQTRGGVQEVVFFPDNKTTLELVKVDEIPALAGSTAAVVASKLGRYRLQLGPLTIFIWTDPAGRVAMIANPSQNFAAIRKEYLGVAPALQALVAPPKVDYSAPAGASFTAEEVTVQARGHTLAGTLLLPKNATGKLPAVITITGSGQQTRDEPMPWANLEKFRPFRQIAEALASRGIAVLRVDDRGVGGSTGLDGINDVTTADFADDTRAQVAYLRARKEIDPDRIALVGHSEGGIIGPMVAADDPRIAATAILAGTGQKGDQVLLYQFNRPLENDPTIPEAEKVAARATNATMIRTTAEGGDTSKFPLILRFHWTQWFLNYDPLPALRKVQNPILIIQGELDRQVTADNAELLRKTAEAAGNHAVEVHVLPGMNHLFLPAKTGDEAEYSTITMQELSAEFMNILSSWLVKTLKVQ
jgi:dienelactone hydrolase